MKAVLALLVVSATPFIACSKSTNSYRFDITSDTNWTSTYERVGRPESAVTVSGTGDKTISVPWAPSVCIIVDNLEPTGTIKVAAIKHVHHTGGLLGSDEDVDVVQDQASTSDPTGEVGACTQ
jgi:hypothetical protein